MIIVIEDWKNPAAYRRYAGFTEEQFRWEFLRRTPSYQTAWLESAREGWRESFYADSELKFGVSTIQNPGENFPPKFVDPTLIPASDFLNEDTRARVLDFVRLSAARGQFLLSFDPRVSFDRNIDRLREEFDTEVSEWGITRRRETLGPYPDYLRIIDARATGATFPAIQEQLSSHDTKEVDADAIRRVFARAKEAARKLTGADWDA